MKETNKCAECAHTELKCTYCSFLDIEIKGDYDACIHFVEENKKLIKDGEND